MDDHELVLQQPLRLGVPPLLGNLQLARAVPHLRLPSKRFSGRLQLLHRHHRALHVARGPQLGPLRGVAGGTARHGRGTWGAPEEMASFQKGNQEINSDPELICQSQLSAGHDLETDHWVSFRGLRNSLKNHVSEIGGWELEVLPSALVPGCTFSKTLFKHLSQVELFFAYITEPILGLPLFLAPFHLPQKAQITGVHLAGLDQLKVCFQGSSMALTGWM